MDSFESNPLQAEETPDFYRDVFGDGVWSDRAYRVQENIYVLEVQSLDAVMEKIEAYPDCEVYVKAIPFVGNYLLTIRCPDGSIINILGDR